MDFCFILESQEWVAARTGSLRTVDKCPTAWSSWLIECMDVTCVDTVDCIICSDFKVFILNVASARESCSLLTRQSNNCFWSNIFKWTKCTIYPNNRSTLIYFPFFHLQELCLFTKLPSVTWIIQQTLKNTKTHQTINKMLYLKWP